METYAKHKSAMIKPRKARMTLDLIRGKKVTEAEAILENTNTLASRLIFKVLKSATANATNNLGLSKEELAISECFIDAGPIYKRFKFGSRTKIDRRDKRTSHITIKVSDGKVGA
ncbi:MAG TPA: 50S ribosomal protein L22 [Bacilli bacterium]|nr:50S ribosomal protein L22 [Bacilli bacterium]